MLGLILLGGVPEEGRFRLARSGPSEAKPVIVIGGMCQVHAGALGSERVKSKEGQRDVAASGRLPLPTASEVRSRSRPKYRGRGTP